MSDLTNKIIWVLREPRSGSVWFTQKLAKTLGRKSNFVDSRIPVAERNVWFEGRSETPEDSTKILSTHLFVAIKSMSNFTTPILVRTTRKDRTEQFLSSYIGKYTNIKNMHYDNAPMPTIEPIVVPEKPILNWVQMVLTNKQLWEQYSGNYQNETVYYEDLVEGFSSSLLSINNWSMKTETDPSLPKKIAYNKRDIVLNYDKVDQIIKDHLS